MSITKLKGLFNNPVNQTNGNGEKVYICYKTSVNEKKFIALENGNFYRLNEKLPKRLSHLEVFEVLFGISDLKYQIIGFGHYGESLLNESNYKNSEVV